jgi:hypothetical protein
MSLHGVEIRCVKVRITLVFDVHTAIRNVRRPYFVCPGVVNGTACGRRVAKLYGPGRYFVCRHCYRLAYCHAERDRVIQPPQKPRWYSLHEHAVRRRASRGRPDDPSTRVRAVDRSADHRPFMPLPSFDAVVSKFASSHDAPKSSLEVFTLLCEEIVDRVADILEHLAGELNGLSIDAFHADDTRGRHAARANHVLRVQLRQVGRLGDRFSEVRDGLQGLGRIVAYTDQYACEWSGGALKPRVAALRQDIHSLIEYEEQLSSKVQLVLDALVGLIGIAQNDVFKVLTIVSIVGIPPTLMAGIYGMNFKNMPETVGPTAGNAQIAAIRRRRRATSRARITAPGCAGRTQILEILSELGHTTLAYRLSCSDRTLEEALDATIR